MITDYASLRQTIADWLARADLTNQIPTFIQLAEKRMNKDLRVLDMHTQVTGVATDKQIIIPDDCLEIASVRILLGTIYKEIHPLPPERLADKEITTYFPIGYVRIGSILYLIGGNTSAESPLSYSMAYYTTISALSDTPTVVEAPGGGTTTIYNNNNWLLTKEPGMYLYASLIETAPYLKDDPRLAVWGQQYNDILSAMRKADDRARYGNAPARQLPRFAP